MKPPDAKKIARILISEIESQKYAVGSTLPTRHELADKFGVARGTVDCAVRELGRRGLVVSRRRAGSLVVNTSSVVRIALLGGSSEDAAIETRSGIVCTPVPFDSIHAKTDREKLVTFDGLVWHQPNKTQLKWSDELEGRIPQILINRKNPLRNFVSTDHAEAIFQITRERIAKHPGWLPVFLESDEDAVVGVVALRREGFIRACREHNVFYDIVPLPDAFDAKITMLRKSLDSDLKKPLLIVSDSHYHTGAVTLWVRESGRRWLKDILYSDFDDTMPLYVWGVSVTSCLQDYSTMRSLAVQGLVDLIRGKKKQVQILQPPLRRIGDT